MDACYSGLGLVRGGGRTGGGNFLRDNAHRVGRQMLTAGGADQMVADGGPGGHSIFTWTLLQGLSGKADLNGDNIITGTELAAYIAPAVASVSQQTPAFGSLPGSEGGEFVFTLAANEESHQRRHAAAGQRRHRAQHQAGQDDRGRRRQRGHRRRRREGPAGQGPEDRRDRRPRRSATGSRRASSTTAACSSSRRRTTPPRATCSRSRSSCSPTSRSPPTTSASSTGR